MDAENKVDILDLDGNNGCEHCAGAGKGKFLKLLVTLLIYGTGKMTLKCKQCGNTVRPTGKALHIVAAVENFSYFISMIVVVCLDHLFLPADISFWHGSLYVLAALLAVYLIGRIIEVFALMFSKWVRVSTEQEGIDREYKDVDSKYSRIAIRMLFAIAIILFILLKVLF